MFGRLKNLFKKSSPDGEDEAPFIPETNTLIKVHKAAPRPAPEATEERSQAKMAHLALDKPAAQRLSLALEPIVQKFPDALKAALPSLPSPNQKIDLTLEELPEQLKRGSVRVTFGEIRKALPSAFAGVDLEFDRLFVNLPIAIIVPQVKLDRRKAHFKVAVPEEGLADFDLKRRGDNAPLGVADAPKPVVEEMLAPPEPSPRSHQVAEAPPVPASPTLRLAVDDSAPLSATPPEPPAESPETASDIVRLAVSEIEDYLSGAEMTEVTANQLESRVIHIPIPALAPMMERGRVLVTWGELLQWMRPPGPPSPCATNRIELPLPLIAPRFHEVASPGAPASEVPDEAGQPPGLDGGVLDIDIDLEDLVVEEPPADRPVEEPAEPEVAAFDEHEEWRPESVVARLRLLDGVDGAVIASREGLVVASDVSSYVDSDIFAAFLPEITVRTTVYVTEMNLPAPDLMEISLGEQKLLLIPAGDLFVGLIAARSAIIPVEKVRDMAQGLHQFGSLL